MLNLRQCVTNTNSQLVKLTIHKTTPSRSIMALRPGRHVSGSIKSTLVSAQLLSLIQCVTPDEARAGFPHSSLFTPLPSLLAFGRSGLFGPPLCGGSAPATPPLLKPPAAASVWQYDLDDPLRPGFPPNPASWHIQSMCQRRQARRGNSHTYPTFTAMTIASPLQKYSRYIPPDRPHTAHTEHGLAVTFSTYNERICYFRSGLRSRRLICLPLFWG